MFTRLSHFLAPLDLNSGMSGGFSLLSEWLKFFSLDDSVVGGHSFAVVAPLAFVAIPPPAETMIQTLPQTFAIISSRRRLASRDIIHGVTL